MKNKTEAKTRGRIPKLRFPEFRETGEWEVKELGELCKIQTGKKDANEGTEDGIYPFFTCAENHIYSKSYSFDTEAIMVAGNANVGQTTYYNGKFEAYQRTYVLTDFSDIAVSYLYSLLSANLRRELLNQVQTSAMSYIKLSMLKEYALTIPPTRAEQQKIADCLSSLDDLIAAHRRKLDALKAHKRGLMQQLFPAAGDTAPRLRFPEFRDAGEWEEKSLEHICQMQAGKFVSASEIQEKESSGLFPCFGGNGLRGFTQSSTHSGRFPLIGRQGALCGNITLAIGTFHATEHAVVCTPFSEVFVDWLYFQLINLNLNQYATGQAQPGLSVEVLKKVIVKIPRNYAEQQKIADCLSALDDLIALQTRAVATLDTHKRGLLQQLFPAADDAAG